MAIVWLNSAIHAAIDACQSMSLVTLYYFIAKQILLC